MTEDKQSAALARWLDAGGRGDPPAGIDEDVLEALFALRPDLAPAPQLDLDDLLAGITTGPFAATADDEPGGEVVPFPVPASLPADADPDVLSAPRARPAARPWWRQWAVGGVAGTLAAAAAVLLVVVSIDDPSALPSPAAALRRPSAKEEAQAVDRDELREQAASAEPEVAQVTPPDAAPRREDQRKAGPLDAVALGSTSSRGDGAPAAEKKKDATAERKEAQGNTGTAGLRDAETVTQWEPPEPLTQTGLSAPSNTATYDDAVVYGEQEEVVGTLGFAEGAGARTPTRATAPGGRVSKSAPAAPTAAAEAPPPPAPTADRSFNPTDDWRASLDAATRQRVDGALQIAALRASQGAPRTAALDLRPYVQAPTRAGQAVAAQAAQYALQAGDDRLAAELIDLGLALGGPGTTEHTALLRLRSSATPAKARASDAAPAEAEAK